MTELLKKRVSIVAVCAVFGVTGAVTTADKSVIAVGETANMRVTTVEETTEYRIENNYKYVLEKAFTRSPDTFEAWVNMPVYSVGGTLMSNWTGEEMKDGTVAWSVDGLGRVHIQWNNRKLDYTFAERAINDGEWHHLAVVRDPAEHTFTLYIDGEYSDGVKCVQKDLDGKAYLPMCIGVDYRSKYAYDDKYVKEPFDGAIRQVTVYNGAVSVDRIRSDMQTAEITDDYGGKIMGNWYLGERWIDRTVEDTTANGNNATIATFDKFVGLADTDFEYDYTIIGLPDIQCLVEWKYNKYMNMMKWIVDNSTKLNTKFVFAVGDLSNIGNSDQLFDDAASGFALLDNKIPYSVVQGNHDYDDMCKTDRTSTWFDKYFPYSKHRSMLGFGGVYEEGTMSNSYYLFNAAGVDYCMINLEVAPRMEVIRWAGRICETYPNHRVIVQTHSYIGSNGDLLSEYDPMSPSQYGWAAGAKPGEFTTSRELYDNLIGKYKNVFMAFSGHIGSDDIMVRRDTGVNCNTVTSMLIDAQSTVFENEKSEDIMFIMKVNERKRLMSCCYYSPSHNAVYNLQNQFRLAF